MDKRKQLDEILEYAAERGIIVPADILLEISKQDTKELIKAINLKLKLSDLPNFTLTKPGLVPAPQKHELVLTSDGWNKLPKQLVYIGAGGGGGIIAETDPVFLASEAAGFAAGDVAKLAGIEAGAEVNNISDVNATDLTDGGATTLHTHAGGGDISGTGVAGQVAEFVTNTKTLQSAKIIGPAANILTITNSAASTLALAITNTKTLTLTSIGDFNLTIPATGTAALGTGSAGQVGYWSGANSLTGAATLTYQTIASPNLFVQAANAAHIPMQIKGANAQSTDLTQWLDGTWGTVSARIDKAGHLGIGQPPATDQALFVYGSTVGITQVIFARFLAELYPTSAPSVDYFGFDCNITVDNTDKGTAGGIVYSYRGKVTSSSSSHHTLNEMTGAEFYVDHAGSGALVKGTGGHFVSRVQATGGNAIDLASLRVDINHLGASTITDSYGVNLAAPTNTGGGTITRQYGLYINNYSVGATNYAIYTNSGLIRFGDQASIIDDNVAAGVNNLLALTALGSGANGDGGSILYNGKTSTTAATAMGLDQWLWVDATHASRKARRVFNVYDTAVREAFRIEASGSLPMLSFYGGGAVVRGSALTAQLTTLTYTAPGTPDYALQDITNLAPYGFTDAEELRTFISVVKNLQDRCAELEARLGSATGVNLFA